MKDPVDRVFKILFLHQIIITLSYVKQILTKIEENKTTKQNKKQNNITKHIFIS